MKRVILTALILGAVTAAAIVTVFTISSDDQDSVASATTTLEPPATAIVARKDFVEVTEIEGVLGFGTISPLPNLASGVVTWLPEAGTVIEFGDVLYRINDRPVIYVPGELPAYRAMNTRTDGGDVVQLETYLDSLGLMEVWNAAVDGDYTSYTAAVVEDWYETYGLENQQSIDVGMIVFGVESFRINSVNAALGSQVNGGSILSTTATTRLVTVDLDTSLTGLLEVGDVVDVELPDDSVVAATVDFVSQVAVTEGQGQQSTTYVPIELTLSGAGVLFDESPVTIFVEEAIELDATVVPISALLALAEGGYAIEVMRDGQPVLTGVHLSNFLNNEVSIVGEVQPGDEVVVPS